jgi:hypothetical protein
MYSDKRNQPEITSKTIEDFQKIQTLLDKLPHDVIEQISHVKLGGVGLECIFKEQYQKGPKYHILPPSQISDFGDYIGIYAGDYFFKITGKNY